ncbi:HAD family hydrolase [Halobiforma lacisalsi AJ5]|uniref:HAD family hydrolase n=1 Tax=Natronobacterium lacisalsi AJ5 TaxID=358396 RepID=M0LGN6_NATLA|nr:HAD-IIA family hydrolase [Halobiforma lacisalsi]APW98763.1 HAD family hydrolase [Halobiforma lacisalsi AJ5]EMA32253.1 HAD-superfamily hydrolase [Halobiforma lacisalsi AJ5]
MTDYEGAILDVDGTIVRGDQLIPGASDGLRALEDAGVSRLLFSNNPTRGSDHYREKLAPHGVDIGPDRVLTSATVSASYLARNHPDAHVYLVGGNRLASILEDAAISVTDDPEAADVVLGSFDRGFSYGTLGDALRAFENERVGETEGQTASSGARANGGADGDDDGEMDGDADANAGAGAVTIDGPVPFYGTDPDATIPVENGTIPGSGAILAAMEAVAGREPDAVLGKPSDVAADAALDRLGVAPESVLVVGDRLDTDIALGNRAGMTTAVVLSGVTDRATLEESPIQPDYVLESLGEVERLL